MKPTIASIFRQFGPEYRIAFGNKMLPSHQQAMFDIERCRTETFGGHLATCKDCDEREYSYHSCNNRHCPQCQNGETSAWIEKQKEFLLPVDYFFVTFTLPDPLRQFARSHQEIIYHLLFVASSAAMKELARDKRFIGAEIGMVGVLQTWTRNLHYHPHIHYIVPGCGISAEGKIIFPKNKDFFVHVHPLSRLFRRIFKELLKKQNLYSQIPAAVWEKDWVVHCQTAGRGLEVVKYIAPYVYRIAIANSRIVKVAGRTVSFTFRNSQFKQWQECFLDAREFIRRFLQHVLPDSFVKIRYYGFLAPNKRTQLKLLKQLLPPSAPPLNNRSEANNLPTVPEETAEGTSTHAGKTTERKCSKCGGRLIHLERLKPQYRIRALRIRSP